MEDYIILKGRCGLEYYDNNGQGYFIDTELCASVEYDYAIYIDSIKALKHHSCLDEKSIQNIINRVSILCKEKNMKPRIFHDNT